MAKNVRIERLNDAFQEEISMILMTEIKDDDIRFVTITGVETTTHPAPIASSKDKDVPSEPVVGTTAIS